jgi:hypothetical protein
MARTNQVRRSSNLVATHRRYYIFEEYNIGKINFGFTINFMKPYLKKIF